MIDTIILNIIYLIFPLTLFVIYCIYANICNRKINDLILSFFLITSFYFLIRFGSPEISYLPYGLLLIPILLSYINKSFIGIILLNIATFSYYLQFKYSFIMIFGLVIYYLIYHFIYLKFNKKKLFILSVLIINVIIIIISSNPILKIDFIFYILESLILPYIIIMMINSFQNAANLHINLQNIEREKQVRLSIFKITHEIKNPIAVCKGYLDMFDISNKEHSEKYIPIIKSEINRTLCLLQDFLDFNKIKLEKEEIDLILLLEDIKSSCLPLLSNGKIKCETNFLYNDEEIYMDGDYNRLKQVFINIIKNSIEALNDIENPYIKINYTVRKDYVHIYIEDNGCGMNKEVLNKVKEPFFTTKNNGTGLGVTISKEIIQGHSGIIKYSSKENVGTKVEIILPVKKQK